MGFPYTFPFYFDLAPGLPMDLSVSESLTTAETLARVRTTGLSVSENITGSEALAKVRETPKVLAEALTMAEVLATWLGALPIDIGTPAIDTSASSGGCWTVILLDNPANNSDTLDTAEVWAHTDLGGTTPFKVGTFHGSGTTYEGRDSEVLGTVTAGSKQTFTGLSIDTITGDLLGMFWAGGSIDVYTEGRAGYYWYEIDCYHDAFGIGPVEWGYNANSSYSCYATGGNLGETFQAHISEDITGSEALAAVSGLLGVLAEAITASEVLAVQWDLKPSVSEALTAAETLDAQAAFLMSMSENMTAAEALDAISTLYAAVSESFTESEALARMVETTHVVTDTVAVSETVALVRLLYRALSDNVGIADSSVANLALYLLTLKLYARALTMKTQATSLTVKLHSRDLAVKIPEVQ